MTDFLINWMADNEIVGIKRTDATDHNLNTRYVSQEDMINFLLKEPEKIDTLSLTELKRAFDVFNTIWDKTNGSDLYYDLDERTQRHLVWTEPGYKWDDGTLARRRGGWWVVDMYKDKWIEDILKMNPSHFNVSMGFFEVSFMDIICDQNHHQDFVKYWQ